MNTFYRMSAVVVLTGLACAVARAQTPSPSDDIAYALFYGNPDRPTLKANATDAAAVN